MPLYTLKDNCYCGRSLNEQGKCEHCERIEKQNKYWTMRLDKNKRKAQAELVVNKRYFAKKYREWKERNMICQDQST